MWIDDTILAQAAQDMAVAVWVPESAMVVLGSSNKPEREANVAACEAAGVPILKRYGGGGTVVLYPGCVVLSLGTWVKSPFDNDRYFRRLNQAVIDTLAASYPACASLTQRGISDIAWCERKVAGTSMFRSRHYLLYQASLLVTADLPLIEQVLAYPSKEPDYRQGRSHRDFITDLQALLPGMTANQICERLKAGFAAQARYQLQDELWPVQDEHLPHLAKRVQRHREQEAEWEKARI